MEYIRSIGVRQAEERVIKPTLRRFDQDLQRLSRQFRDSPIRIGFKVQQSMRYIPLALYQGRDVETRITCEHCYLEFAVYGVFARCPDCARMNAHSVFRQSLAAARKRLVLYGETDDVELREALLTDILKSAVGAFDAVGKELRRRSPGTLPEKTPNLFQNLEALNKALQKYCGRCLRAELGDDSYDELFRMFQVRHIYEHNLGVVDEQFIQKVPQSKATVGRMYHLDRQAVERFLDLLGQAFEATARFLGSATGA
jgi:hypothetical protein